MFDIGAQELLLVAIVMLIVIGPERMPRFVRAAGLWFGRARRALMTVKSEIDHELKAEELRDIIRKQQMNRPLETFLNAPPTVRPPLPNNTTPASPLPHQREPSPPAP